MRLLCFISFIMIAAITYAQSKYYNESKEIQCEDYTYSCVVRNNVLVTLVNTESVYRGLKQIDLASEQEVEEMDISYLQNDDISHKQLLTVCGDILAQYLITEMDKNHAPLELGLYINPQTGKIMDVTFSFAAFRKCGQLPPSVYRELELRLKKDVHFEASEEGKRVNYIYRQTMYYQK